MSTYWKWELVGVVLCIGCNALLWWVDMRLVFAMLLYNACIAVWDWNAETNNEEKKP